MNNTKKSAKALLPRNSTAGRTTDTIFDMCNADNPEREQLRIRCHLAEASKFFVSFAEPEGGADSPFTARRVVRPRSYAATPTGNYRSRFGRVES